MHWKKKEAIKFFFGFTFLTYGDVSLRNASSGCMSKSGTRSTHIQVSNSKLVVICMKNPVINS